jgi:hypothetical protein
MTPEELKREAAQLDARRREFREVYGYDPLAEPPFRIHVTPPTEAERQARVSPTIHFIDQSSAGEMDIRSASTLAMRSSFYSLHAMTPEGFASDPVRVMIRILTLINKQCQLETGNERLRGALEAVEWVPAFTAGPRLAESCPACLRYRASGHAPGCSTAAALQRSL